ncbi:MAG: TIR domain-containing protein [Moorea sp. SIOASIH]|uniref:TIR domain-containing protein n=1 Tax=Moorena sp. SIOASIH TaxID=2607817 RepID=UPI0013BB807F|nr:TIR domain-containing protein [Moorena sp. SIOASIH]NEO35988.1 TIR domain-containing protein [Moorena sp. SIOASIH]
MKTFFDAFISYGRADSKAFATRLHQRLTELGFSIWFDQQDIPLGVDFQNQIDDGIEKSHNFLFIIAPHSVKSPYCLKEIQLAVKLNKRIIPLLHVEPTDCWDKMHPIIQQINWVYFRDNTEDFETSLAGLLKVIHHQGDYVRQHTEILVKALEWSRHHKQTNYLLIGEEKKQAQSWLKVRFTDQQPPCVPTDLQCELISESTKNANNLLTQVFICYADQDKPVMQKIAKTLMRKSFTVWTNKTDIETGTRFQDVVYQGIEGADNIVYLISPASLKSDYCQQEITHALVNNKRIIPLLIESTELEWIPPHIRALQFIDFTTYNDEAKYRIDADKLIKGLHQEQPYYSDHKRLLVKAIKWKNQNLNPSILLRGYNLRYYQNWLTLNQQRNSYPPLPIHHEFITESSHQIPSSSLEVFISYSRADSDFARKLNEALEMQGKSTWFDQESIPPGSDFQQEIYRGIENSDNFLFIISPRSVNSPYCADEVEYAQSLNKRFVTILHHEVAAKVLHPALARIQWIDFRNYRGDFYANFSELIRTLDTDREHVHNHTKLSQRSLEWEKNHKSLDLLLRGIEFSIAQKWFLEAKQDHKYPPPTPLQKEFLEASNNTIEAAREAEKQRQVEIIRLQEERTKEAKARLAEQKKRVRQQKLFIVGVIIALVAAVGTLIHQIQEKKLAEYNLKIARVNHLLSEARTFLKRHPTKALRIAEAAYKIDNTHQVPEVSQLLSIAYHSAIHRRFFFYSANMRHKRAVTSAVFSPDGSIILTASEDTTARLWNLKGERITTLAGHSARVNSAVFSPDGNTIVTTSQDKTAKLWDKEGNLLNTLRGHDCVRNGQCQVNSAVFSPDGQTILTASEDKTAKLWDKHGQLIKTLSGHKDIVVSAVFSPDGQAILTASRDKTAKLWDKDGNLITTLDQDSCWHVHIKDYHCGLTSAVFSPDGTKIITTSKDKTAKLWDHNGKLIHIFKGHTGWVNSAFFSQDGDQILTASEDGTAKLWNKDGKLIKTLAGHSEAVKKALFSPDGNHIITVSDDDSAKIWDLDGNAIANLIGHQLSVTTAAFAPHGDKLITASDDSTVKLWDITQQPVNSTFRHSASVNSAVFSPDGTKILTATTDKNAYLWDLSGKLLKQLPHDCDVWNHCSVKTAAFSPNGNYIITTSDDGKTRLWNGKGDRLIMAINLHDHYNNLRIFGRNGAKFSSFSQDDQQILTTSYDQTAKLWNFSGSELIEISEYKGHKGVVNSAALSPNRQQIITASNDKLAKLWNVNGEIITDFKGHTDAVNSAVFSPDGKTILTASADHTIKLWDLNGNEIRTFGGGREQGHKFDVNSAVFSPDGKTILSASSDKTARLWDLNGRLILVMRDNNAAVNSAVFSPDGTKILTAFSNGTARVWLKPEAIYEWLQTAKIYQLSPGDRKVFGLEDRYSR